MRTTQILSISIPPALLQQFEEVRKKESRTRSELVREALRAYFEQRYPALAPTAAELAALRRGRAAFRRGDSVSLTQYLNGIRSNGLEPSNHGSRAKRVSKVSRQKIRRALNALLAMQQDPF
jgi:Arc/MetJ-type ribon-helix-helix transcriptional regulator